MPWLRVFFFRQFVDACEPDREVGGLALVDTIVIVVWVKDGRHIDWENVIVMHADCYSSFPCNLLDEFNVFQ